MPMTISSQEETKDLLRQVLVELFNDKKSELHEIIVESIEEIALANAIRDGRKDQFVSEDEIQAVLEM